MPEQVRTDLALLERGKVDAIDASGQQPRARLVLRINQRQPVQILAVAHREFFRNQPSAFQLGRQATRREPPAEVAHGRGDPPAVQLPVRRFAAACSSSPVAPLVARCLLLADPRATL